MASNYKDITGRIVATAQVTAKPGKADEMAQWLANLKARADSDVEPGTLGYHIVRHGDRFAIWEEYADKAALDAHGSSALIKEFFSLNSIEPGFAPAFYPADSLPAPTMKF